MKLAKISRVPLFKRSVESIYSELGDALGKNATSVNLTRHLPTHERSFAKDVVRVFIAKGLLREVHPNRYAWTKKGLEYAQSILGLPP